ncbi:amino acid ABC transporter permease [Pediococcus argentinicus]|uniref:amino acid ABC transporter permease n=1 Tax=Pediococcus argentinicus TaxID=480391 RepID=UPI00338DEFD1
MDIINYALQILPSLMQGALMTLQIFCWTIIGSLILGAILALGLVSKFGFLKKIISGYVWLMRGTPLLLQLIFVFYGLPTIHIIFPRYEAALFAFILNYAAYFAEIFRGGLQAVDQGQYEAGRVLQMSYWQITKSVVMPQVAKIVLPSLGNEVINLVKDSSLVYVIGLGDLLRAGNVAAARDVSLVPFILVGIIYLLLTAICTYFLRRVEKHYSYFR